MSCKGQLVISALRDLGVLLLHGAAGAGPALFVISGILVLIASPFVLAAFLRSARPTRAGWIIAVLKALAALLVGVVLLYVVLFYAV